MTTAQGDQHPDEAPAVTPEGPARSVEPTAADREEMERTARELAPSTEDLGGQEERFDNYEAGREVDGKTIAFVFGRHHGFVVYRTTDGLIGWRYPDAPPEAAPIIGEFSRLGALGRAILDPDRARREEAKGQGGGRPRSAESPELAYFVSLLGSDLHSALLGLQEPSGPGDPAAAAGADAAGCFARTWEMLNQHVDSAARRRHVLAGSVTALIILGALGGGLALPGQAGPFLLPAAGGVIGALMSLLPRSVKLEFTPFHTPFQIYSEAALRVVLGVLFGFVLGLMMRAELALGPLAGSAEGLVVAGILAGFFERFVPDLLATTVSRHGSAERPREDRAETRP